MRRPADVPAYAPDLHATRAIVDPHPHYARLRRLGPVVWLTKQRVYALPRYAQCKAVLRDDMTFISDGGRAAKHPVDSARRRGAGRRGLGISVTDASGPRSPRKEHTGKMLPNVAVAIAGRAWGCRCRPAGTGRRTCHGGGACMDPVLGVSNVQ